MIQDIFPYKLDNSYKADIEPKETDYVLLFQNHEILVSEENIMLPTVSDMGKAFDYRYLFCIGEESFFLCDYLKNNPVEAGKDKEKFPEHFLFKNVRELRGENSLPKQIRFAIMTGKHLFDWYRDSRFCGRCGSRMVHSKNERAMCCYECHNTVYPRIMPAVIVGVMHQDALLLTRYRTGFAHNALVAGFTEIGETLEETVSREVAEETGLKVKNIRYYKSQPWGIANDILMGFFCDVDGDTTITMDEDELKMACFTKREDIVLQPDDASLTNEMMKVFKENRL